MSSKEAAKGNYKKANFTVVIFGVLMLVIALLLLLLKLRVV